MFRETMPEPTIAGPAVGKPPVLTIHSRGMAGVAVTSAAVLVAVEMLSYMVPVSWQTTITPIRIAVLLCVGIAAVSFEKGEWGSAPGPSAIATLMAAAALFSSALGGNTTLNRIRREAPVIERAVENVGSLVRPSASYAQQQEEPTPGPRSPGDPWLSDSFSKPWLP